ncbi:VPLPA-CTERM sorting domain-containing protein [Tropicimonas sp. S265A]|uniref:VPLPA-CTERM sorting domain-containing protein n=1 Tax=Tropicimonas sp. S265A TaxID=3415134 RepID=UPI003C7EBA9C
MSKVTLVSAVCLFLSCLAVQAATIGSLSAERVHIGHNKGGYALTGALFQTLRSDLESDGHTVKAGTPEVTASYLSDVDLFFTGLPHLDQKSAGAATTLEQGALKSWVMAGGTLIVIGDDMGFDANVNTWLSPFGLTLMDAQISGGTWTSMADPLMTGSLLGATYSQNKGGYYAADGFTAYATTDGKPSVVGSVFGQGRIFAFADVNSFGSKPGADERQFVRNVAGMADVPPVPLPAGLWLLLSGMGGLAVARRKGRRPERA